MKKEKENWVKRISFTDDKLTIDGVVINDVEDVDILIDFIENLLKSEKEKSYKDGLERAYEIICGYPEANVMQPRLDIKEEIKKLKKEIKRNYKKI